MKEDFEVGAAIVLIVALVIFLVFVFVRAGNRQMDISGAPFKYDGRFYRAVEVYQEWHDVPSGGEGG